MQQQDKLYEMLIQEDEITWQTIIYDLVKSEEMDPWDIDVSLLAKKYLETIKKLQEMNFNLSGKIVLASAILIKLKTRKLVEEDLARFENIINPPEEIEEMYNDLDLSEISENRIIVIPKTPQPRRRKVSINDFRVNVSKKNNFVGKSQNSCELLQLLFFRTAA